jgi:RHS repeat-associated protein
VLDIEGSRAGSGTSATQNNPIGNARYYAKARYYGAGRGSFISVDPWDGDPTSPVSLNKYLYGYANPGAYVDPDGRQSMSPEAAMAYARTMLPPEKQADWDRKSNAYLKQLAAEQEGSTAGVVEWARENITATAEFGRDALAAGVEHRLPGLVDFGGRRAMEQRGEALGNFLANDPIGTIRTETSRIEAEAAALRDRGQFAEAQKLRTKLGLDYISAGAGAYGVVRAGVSGVSKLGKRLPEPPESAPVRIVEGDGGPDRPVTLTPEQFVSTLRSWPTRTGKASGRFEVEQTGPLNYRVPVGNETFDMDGFEATTIIDAKYVGDPRRSPYVDGSSAPSFLRELVKQDQLDEIRRMQAIVDDPSIPFDSFQIRTNNQGAATYFERLILEREASGSVLVVPTNVKPR